MPLQGLPIGFACKGIARISQSFTLIAGTIGSGPQWSDQKVVVLAVNAQSGHSRVIWESMRSDLTGGGLMKLSDEIFVVATKTNTVEIIRVRSRK